MRIAGCEMVPYTDSTERDELDRLVIVGRARLTPAEGGLIHALVCRCPDEGRLFGVYLNRHTGRFEIFAVEAKRD